MFYSATCYDIGGDTSLDGVGTIINLGMINFLACLMHAHFLYVLVYLERIIDAYNH